jgi:hypothetical protein
MLVFLFFLIFSPIALIFIIYLVGILYGQILGLFIRPKLNRAWNPLFEKLGEIDIIENGEIFVRNIRNARYNPVFEFENKVTYLNKKYNLNDLEQLWLIVNPYAPLQSHVLLTFQFGEDSQLKSFLSISYEVRKTDVENFNASNAVFKPYEGMFILATEEDTVFVRTNIRENNNVYLFPLNIQKEKIQNVFRKLSEKINMYNKKAYSYKPFSRNCLTEIFTTLYEVGIINTKNKFRYLNILRLLYSQNIVSGSDKLNYTNFKKKFYITTKARSYPADAFFSINIRK